MRLESRPATALCSQLCLRQSWQGRARRLPHSTLSADYCSWRSTPSTEQQRLQSTTKAPVVRTYSTSSPTFKETARTTKPGAAKSTDFNQVRMETRKRAEKAAARARARVAEKKKVAPQQGSLADESLFSEKKQLLEFQRAKLPVLRDDPSQMDPSALELRNPNNLAMAIDPRPDARARGLRRMVIRSVRQRGRVTKEVKLARTERSSLSRSEFFKTSMKKLAPLARQIAGKPIDEAILQMRFSKKKVAKEVREHLLHAKNEAIVRRGMGLPSEPKPTAQAAGLISASSPATTSTPSSSTALAIPAQPSAQLTSTPKYLPGTLIASQPSERKLTEIYIAQSWINRGPYGRAPDYRAMGRINIMRPPQTGISVLLKEEKTRLREVRDREEKRIRQRVGLKSMWKQLPDRKIVRQSQYVLW